MPALPAPAAVILAAEADPTADRVASELAGRGVSVVWMDTADFPTRLSLAAEFSAAAGCWSGRLAGPTESGRTVQVDVDRVQSIYFRHPTQFRLAQGTSGPEQIFSYNEARRGFGGVLQALDCRWVNHPLRAAAAEYKPVQLAAAAAAGLRVPDSTITNDPAYARTGRRRIPARSSTSRWPGPGTRRTARSRSSTPARSRTRKLWKARASS